MKIFKRLFIIIAMLTSCTLHAQVAITSDGSSADGSALLEVKSTDKGFLPPRMTGAERDAIADPATALLVFCTDCGTNGELQVYNGTEWTKVDSSPASNPIFGSLTDPRDGNTYSTVQIGDQLWMAENLAYLPSVGGGTNNTVPYYYVYNYQGTDVEEAKFSDYYQIYGALYNWAAASTACPEGWHLPSDGEWCILEQEVDPSITCNSSNWRGTDGGGKLKESGTSHWQSPNEGATNSSWFTALPGGWRKENGIFWDVNSSGRWWTSSSVNGGFQAYSRGLGYEDAGVNRGVTNTMYGYSVRCVKD